MSHAQKFILWGTGVLVLINLVSVGLSWWYFGYLDWQTVWEMALVTFPVVIVALGSYFLLSVEAESGQKQRVSTRLQSHSHEVFHETPSN